MNHKFVSVHLQTFASQSNEKKNKKNSLGEPLVDPEDKFAYESNKLARESEQNSCHHRLL